jgi:hypothetical protein
MSAGIALFQAFGEPPKEGSLAYEKYASLSLRNWGF